MKIISRYHKILTLIDLYRPQTIVETGVWNGENAIRMIRTAQRYHQNIKYVGYDLFEDANAESDAVEFNVKPHNNVDKVRRFIEANCPGAEINLVKGNTRETLVSVTADFAFIDGGHSIETIAHDYEALEHCRVIVFDDYYTPDADGKCPDTTKIGCNRIVKKIPHGIVPANNPVHGGGIINLAVVHGS